PEQLGVPLARYLRAQALAVRITLGERSPRGLGHLACDVKHLKRRTGLAAAGAPRRRQRDFPTADITRKPVWVPSLHARLGGGRGPFPSRSAFVSDAQRPPRFAVALPLPLWERVGGGEFRDRRVCGAATL